MCDPTLALLTASGIAAAAGARQQAKAQQQSLLGDAVNAERAAGTAENQAVVAENNAQLAEYQAQDVLRQGAEQESQIKVAGAQLKGRQKVALAASGVDITTGSAADILTGTDIQTQIDANTARDNALRSAWGYRTQGTSYQDSAGTARADAALYRQDAANLRAGSRSIRPNAAAALSLLGSAGQVAGAWYSGGK